MRPRELVYEFRLKECRSGETDLSDKKDHDEIYSAQGHFSCTKGLAKDIPYGAPLNFALLRRRQRMRPLQGLRAS